MKQWWQEQDGFDVFVGALSLFMIVVGLWFVVWLIHEAHMDTVATCDYFINYDVEDIPARCLAFFSGTGQ